MSAAFSWSSIGGSPVTSDAATYLIFGCPQNSGISTVAHKNIKRKKNLALEEEKEKEETVPAHLVVSLQGDRARDSRQQPAVRRHDVVTPWCGGIMVWWHHGVVASWCGGVMVL